MTTDQERAWIQAWRRAGPELERIRNEELRELDEAEGTRRATLLGLSVRVPRRTTTGLIEFQAWMQKLAQQTPHPRSAVVQRGRNEMTEKPFGINNVLQLAAQVGRRLEEASLSYCFIGGVANQRWGEPRQTVDVDGTIFAGFGQERALAEKLAEMYPARIDNVAEFAIRNRIVLLESAEGIGIDLSLGALPFEERVIARSSVWHVPDHGNIRTCSAEDLVVLKAFASRPQDWIDVEKVIIRQARRLDRNLIGQELRPLVELKEEPEILSQLQGLFGKI